MGRGHIHVAPTIPPAIIREVGQTGWLESDALALALIAAGVVVAVAAVVYARHRHRTGAPVRSRLRRRMFNATAATVASLLALTGGAIALNSYVGYVPTLGSVVSAHGKTPLLAAGKRMRISSGGGSRVVKLSIGAPSLGVHALPAYVYLPPGYSSAANAHRRYPTLYLIHGHPGGASDWFRGGRVRRTMDILLRAHLVQPMIVVTPSASLNWLQDSECLNAVHGAQLETYLTQVVPAAINREFRTHVGRAFTGIGGMSSGAYCALNLGLRHPHVFSLVAASEPYADPGRNAERQMLGMNPALVWANSPGLYLRAMRPPLAQAFFLDAGGRDRHTFPTMYVLAHELANDGQNVYLRSYAHGGHTWRTARIELPYALVFASQHFGRMPSGGSFAGDQALDRELVMLGETRGVPATPTPSPAAVASTSRTPSPSPQRSRVPSRRSGPRAGATQ